MIQQNKDKAKLKIKNKVIFLFFISFIPLVAETLFGATLPVMGSLATLLIGILISFGISNVYLKVSRAKPAVYKDLSIGFTPIDLQMNLVTGLLAESSKVMKGNKANLFLLHLSFIGWALLVMITAGLANIYAMPLYQMALTEFYMEINNDL